MLISNDPLSCFSDLLEDFLFKRIIPNKSSKVVNLTAVNYYDRVSRLVFLVNRNLGDLPYDLHPIDHLTEYHAFPV